MLFIPGPLIAILTFPGIIVHEIAHRLFCHLTGVPVYDVRYFHPTAQPSGYVIHGRPPTSRAALLITSGQLILNSLLCMLLTFGASISTWILKDSQASWVSGLLLWVGISVGMHAFPSNQDASSFVDMVRERRGSGIWPVLAQLFAAVLTVVNALRFVWIDLIYAILLVVLLPLALGLI